MPSPVPGSPEPRPDARYLHTPTSPRTGWALCLSGGGFRAALFHLGALRRLNEAGVLGHLDLVSSVSGGSILAGHVARVLKPWPAAGATVPDWEQRVAAPFRAFCQHDLRTPAIVRSLRHPWRMFTQGLDPEGLETAYARLLTPERLIDLPERPRFVFCATELLTASLWRFERDHISTWRTRRLRPSATDTVARAIAASSCFPPLFAPMTPTREQGRLRDVMLPGGRVLRATDLRLSDGGLYDNLGLQPAIKHHHVVLISDGGTPFEFAPVRGVLGQTRRYVDILTRQVAALRWREFHALRNQGKILGGYWSLTGASPRTGNVPGCYSADFARDVLASIRTDLNPFTEVEAGVLENHGYWQAEATLDTHAEKLGLSSRPPAETPWLRGGDEAELRLALRDRARRLPRGFAAALLALWRGRRLPAPPAAPASWAGVADLDLANAAAEPTKKS